MAQREIVSIRLWYPFCSALAGSLLALCLLPGCGGGDSPGQTDSSDEDTEGGDGKIEACEADLLFVFAVDGRAVAVLAAGEADPLEGAERLVAQALDPATGLVRAEANVPSGEGGNLAVTGAGAGVLRVRLEAQDGDGNALAAGEVALAPEGQARLRLAARPGFVVETQRRDCGALNVQPRLGHSFTALPDGRFLLAGGVSAPAQLPWPADDPANPPLAALELFDPATGEVAQVGTLPAPMSRHVAALLPDGRVALAGGYTLEGSAMLPSSNVWLVDPSKDFAVSPAPVPLAVPRARHAGVWLDGLSGIFLVGGNTGGGGAELWTPQGSTLVNAGQTRVNHTLTFAPEANAVVAIGGELPGAQIAGSFEIWGVGTEVELQGTFGLVEGAERTLHAAAWLPGAKRLYAVGGFRDAAHTQAISSVLVWQSGTTSIVVDSVTLGAPRGAAVALSLPGEDVVVVAGGYGGGTMRSNAEALVVFPAVPPLSGLQTAVAPAPAPPTTFYGAAAAIWGRTWTLWPGGGGAVSPLAYMP